MSETESTETTTETVVPPEGATTAETAPAAAPKPPAPPVHRQYQERVKNMVERCATIVEKMSDWSTGVNTAEGNEVASLIRAQLTSVQPILQNVEGLIAMIPETWKAPAAKAKQIDPATFVVNNRYQLVGQTAKEEPTNAKYPVTLLEVDSNTKRGKVLAEDGSTIRVPLRDLAVIGS